VKRIFILSSHPLFSAGVETLLRDEVELEFVGRETNPDQAVARIKELKPDMVILDTNYVACNADPVLLRIFQEQLGIKVIGMNLQDNRICIYHEEQRVVQSVDDLKSIIHNDANVRSGLDFSEKKEDRQFSLERGSDKSSNPVGQGGQR
jgi:DNA-binding NarL/FixJ family response regulator